MSRFRGSQRLSLRFVFSTVPFCQGEEGSQNHVCVPISACRCGQLTNSVPRSKVIDLRATKGRSFIALMILPITGLVRLFGFLRITVNRLTRSTSDVTLFWPSFCLNSIKSPSQCPNWRRCATSSGRNKMLTSRWNLGSLRLLVRLGRRATRCVGRYHQRS